MRKPNEWLDWFERGNPIRKQIVFDSLQYLRPKIGMPTLQYRWSWNKRKPMTKFKIFTNWDNLLDLRFRCTTSTVLSNAPICWRHGGAWVIWCIFYVTGCRWWHIASRWRTAMRWAVHELIEIMVVVMTVTVMVKIVEIVVIMMVECVRRNAWFMIGAVRLNAWATWDDITGKWTWIWCHRIERWTGVSNKNNIKISLLFLHFWNEFSLIFEMKYARMVWKEASFTKIIAVTCFWLECKVFVIRPNSKCNNRRNNDNFKFYCK